MRLHPEAAAPLIVDDREVKSSELAEYIGLSERAVNVLKSKGYAIPATGRSCFFLKQSIRRYCAYLRQEAQFKSGLGDDATERAERLREDIGLKKAHRELAELRRDALARILVPVSEIVDAWGMIVRDVRALALSIPARCQAELPHLPIEDAEKIRKIVRAALDEAANGLPENAPLGSGESIAPLLPGKEETRFLMAKAKRGAKKGRPAGPTSRLRA